MNSRAERLDKIINAIQAYACHAVLTKPSSWLQSTNKLHPDDAKEQIVALFKECVPEKPTDLCSDWYDGVEFCRTETLKNIEDLR